MNERIKQLEKQAWDYAYDHETVKGNIANGGFINMNFSDAFSQKFAELIVKESMMVTKDYTCNQGWDYSAPVALAKHFGVEE